MGLLIVAAAATAAEPQRAPAPSLSDTHVTYVLPLWLQYQSATDAQFAEQVRQLRQRLPDGRYARVGFTVYLSADFTNWNVDVTNRAAVRAGLAPVIVQIDAAIARAERHGIPICLSVLTALRSRYDPMQRNAERADRRNMQWYPNDDVASGWITHSRYARRFRVVLEAYVRELGSVIADRMARYPRTLVAASGDGEVEMSYDRTLIGDPTYTIQAGQLADYSPFAVAEFRDWATASGLYAPGQPFAGQAYVNADRYRGDVSPGIDSNGDGHTFNGDFAVALATWSLRYLDWSLADDPFNDPNAIPASVYQVPGWNQLPDAGADHFDAPRQRNPGAPLWELWMSFRQHIIWRHDIDFARWITTTADPTSGATVPAERWYSDQIPADYLFGGTPAAPNYRFETSASAWWTADIHPYGSLGITAFNVSDDKGNFFPTLRQVAPLIAERGRRWGVLEYHPSVQNEGTYARYREDVDVFLQYPPSLIVPIYWGDPYYRIQDALFEVQLRELLQRVNAVPSPTLDPDGDGLNDAWEIRFGLNPDLAEGDNGADGDPDGDGSTNLQELVAGTHPRGFATRYLAEGASTAFFETRVALLNPTNAPAAVLLRYLRTDGSVASAFVALPARTRATVDPATTLGGTAEFSTTIESDEAIVVDRTMIWDKTRGYGAHAETGILSPSTVWYLAEGATHSGFNLFYLVQNPGNADASIAVTYLLPGGAPPITKTYAVAANSRQNIWVNAEAAGIPALAATDVSAVLRSINGVPVIVERAMYLDTPGRPFGAGHEAAGVTAPATEWFLAEGATGPFFDLFVLVANPGDIDAVIEARFLLPDGRTVTRTDTVAANSRFNLWVDTLDPLLANTAVSTTIRSTNGVPVIVERAMWWPGPTSATWYEAHNSPGTTATGTMWAMAEGEVGGPRGWQTYVLVANTSAAGASVKVMLLFEDGSAATRTVDVGPSSRFNVDVGAMFGEAAGRRFGVIVESLGASPAPLVVERAMYADAEGVFWAAGTNAPATRVP